MQDIFLAIYFEATFWPPANLYPQAAPEAHS